MFVSQSTYNSSKFDKLQSSFGISPLNCLSCKSLNLKLGSIQTIFILTGETYIFPVLEDWYCGIIAMIASRAFIGLSRPGKSKNNY